MLQDQSKRGSLPVGAINEVMAHIMKVHKHIMHMEEAQATFAAQARNRDVVILVVLEHLKKEAPSSTAIPADLKDLLEHSNSSEEDDQPMDDSSEKENSSESSLV